MKVTACVLALLISTPLLAQDEDSELHGFIDSYHAFGLQEPHDFLSSRSRLRLEATWFGDNRRVFISGELEHNPIADDPDPFQLREAFVDFYGTNWDLRLGRQIIIWGKSDGLQITDLVSPWDFQEFLARDFDDVRLGVDALRFRLLGSVQTLELIFIPTFRPAEYAGPESVWFPGFSNAPESSEPETDLKNAEFGMRLSWYLGWGDLAISAFRSWTDTAQPLPDETGFLRGTYQRVTIYGAEISVPRGSFVYRAEAALHRDQAFAMATFFNFTQQNSDQLKWMGGVEWTPAGGWDLSLQVTDSLITDHNAAMLQPQHETLATLSISKTLMREALTLSSFSFIGLNHGDTFTRAAAEYALTDSTDISAGLDWFAGGEGTLAAFSDNDEVWVQLTYRF